SFLIYNNLSKRYTTQILTLVFKQPLKTKPSNSIEDKILLLGFVYLYGITLHMLNLENEQHILRSDIGH
ncbi:MAG: hypothetical protein K2H17_02175, partial [Duncaniella sp.]|uniref:hypothetical protein n=1 Tax=Duncaniella sp. TaxID=2518496 RepID=UPI0023D3B296